MDKMELVLHDLKDILQRVDEVNHVSHGKAIPVDAEDTFTAIYIGPTADSFEPQAYGTSAGSYDNTLFVRLLINVDCKDDDLRWVRTRRKIIDAVLDDSPLWNNVVDRDVRTSVYDDFASHPKRSMELLFEFRIREDCP